MRVAALPRIIVIAGLLLTLLWIVALVGITLDHAFGA
jgi:hypothetical protein